MNFMEWKPRIESENEFAVVVRHQASIRLLLLSNTNIPRAWMRHGIQLASILHNKIPPNPIIFHLFSSLTAIRIIE
jgi:broad specificity phosphatase PhoE